MTIPMIGNFQVTTFHGLMHPATRKIAVLESDVGTDGVGIVMGGWSPGIIEITTMVDVLNVLAAESLRLQYLALSGTVIEVLDQFAFRWPYTTVMDVRVIYGQTVTGARVTAVWRLVPQTERPPGAEQNPNL